MNKKPSFFRKALSGVMVFLLLAVPMWMPVAALEAEQLVPIGRTAGIKLYVDGVFITRLTPVETASGSVSPAEKAGLEPGDVITALGGHTVSNASDLQAVLSTAGGRTLAVTVSRAGKVFHTALTPAEDTAGNVRLGAYVRDSCAGIGTITFYDPASGIFGALGHGIADKDSGCLIPTGHGNLLGLTVTGVNKGVKGTPGELMGNFDLHNEGGSLTGNLDTGLFGCLKGTELYPALLNAAPIPVADASEVHTGKAQILANVSGETVETYDIEILRVFDADRPTRNMLLRVTDSRLLSMTGGIVQGMSGSPILQDGKIIGAVTHVLVSDPKCGYGIFIENMLSNADAASLDLAA